MRGLCKMFLKTSLSTNVMLNGIERGWATRTCGGQIDFQSVFGRRNTEETKRFCWVYGIHLLSGISMYTSYLLRFIKTKRIWRYINGSELFSSSYPELINRWIDAQKHKGRMTSVEGGSGKCKISPWVLSSRTTQYGIFFFRNVFDKFGFGRGYNSKGETIFDGRGAQKKKR